MSTAITSTVEAYHYLHCEGYDDATISPSTGIIRIHASTIVDTDSGVQGRLVRDAAIIVEIDNDEDLEAFAILAHYEGQCQ